ncbi:MAG: methylenetetrahydrofolate reductase [Bacillota bacterium]|nr:methylenetetrahydrofolate reductase [Bacillota bacterium]
MEEEKNLRQKLARGEFVVTVELEPPRGSDPRPMLAKAGVLAALVDAVNVADSPMANLRMSPIACAHLLQQDLGVEAIFHLTCRDRNLLGLQAELLGAAALGVKNILALTGDRPERGDHPQATGVFDVDALGLARLARTLNAGQDSNGKPLDAPTDFLIGGTASPNAPDLEVEAARLEAKVEAGIVFAQTQPVFDLEQAAEFRRRTAHLGVRVIYGVLPLKSYKSAVYLNTHVPGIRIPPFILERMEKGAPDEGVRLAREILAELWGRVPGVHLFPMGDPALALRLLEGFR